MLPPLHSRVRPCWLLLLFALLSTSAAQSSPRVFQAGVHGGTAAETIATTITPSLPDRAIEGPSLQINPGRALIAFPRLHRDPAGIAAGSRIASAELALWVESAPLGGADLRLRPIYDPERVGPWTPPNSSGQGGVSWAFRDHRAQVRLPWTQAGGDLVAGAAPIEVIARALPNSWVRFDISVLLEIELAGYGIQGYAIESVQGQGLVRLASESHGTAFLRPELSVTTNGMRPQFNAIIALPPRVRMSLVAGEEELLPLPYEDADRTPLTYRLRRGPQKGIVRGTSILSYRALPGERGVDTIEVVGFDGIATSAVATIEVTILPDLTADIRRFGGQAPQGILSQAVVSMDQSQANAAPLPGPIRVDAGQLTTFLRIDQWQQSLPPMATIKSATLCLSVTAPTRATRLRIAPLLDPLNLGAFDPLSATYWERRRNPTLPWLIPGGEIDHATSFVQEISVADASAARPALVRFDVSASIREAYARGAFSGWQLQALDGEPLLAAGVSDPNRAIRPVLILEIETPQPQAVNRPPHALAGPDLHVHIGTRVTLDGRASFDPEGQPLQVQWFDQSGTLGLSSRTSMTPRIEPRALGTFPLILGISDGVHWSIDEVLVTVSDPLTINLPPIARAGGQITVDEGATVRVGATSSDPEGQPLSYSWSHVGGITPARLDLLSSSRARLTAPNVLTQATERSIALRVAVSDGVHTSYDYALVTVNPLPNQPPIAQARGGGTVAAGRYAVLNAQLSSDPDPFTPLSFTWQQLSGPTVALEDSDQPVAWFRSQTNTQGASMDFRVTVSDGEATRSATVSVVVESDLSEFSGTPNSLQPYRDTLTEREARHLLRRAGFGGSVADAARVRAQGLSQSIEVWLNPVPTPALDQDLLLRYGNLGPDFPMARPSSTRLAQWWLEHLMQMPFENMLKERMVLFLSDRFVASSTATSGDSRSHFAHRHFELLRSDPFPRYPDFLLALTRDELMLEYLDGMGSRAGSPNENYAREFWELFALGAINPLTGLENYTETDIQEAARAFTGWESYDPPEIPGPQRLARFNPARFDSGSKTIFGQTGNFNDADVIALTVARPEAAEWLVRNLYLHFIQAPPTTTEVLALAQLLRQSDWQVASVVRVLLRSQAMFSPNARRNQVSYPVEYAVGLLRATGLQVSVSTLQTGLDRLSMRLLAPSNVSGWPEGNFWTTEAALAQRSVVAKDIITARGSLRSANDAILAQLYDGGAAAHPADLIARSLILLDLDLADPATFRALMEYCNTAVQSDLTLTLEPFGSTNDSIDAKPRGLLLLLAAGFPESHLD